MAQLAPQSLLLSGAGWLRTNLFSNWFNSALTIAIVFIGVIVVSKLLGWAIFNAIWYEPTGRAMQCRLLQGQGACWALIAEKYRFALFATYPYDEHWRPAVASFVLVLLYVLSTVRRLWSLWLLMVWAGGLVSFGVLMWGGVLGLNYVSQELWGGLPVTLLLATFGIGAAFPIGVGLALGRRASSMPVIRALCIIYIEVIRGIPLVSLLFMASFLFPLFVPTGVTVDRLLRAQIAIILFAAAYLAEAVRGGLQGVAKGQFEAADALGLGYWTSHYLIVLPQALRIAIPAIVNTSISMLKSTSLVLVVGLFDLLSAAKATIVDPIWQAFGLEMFIAVSLVYFGFCFSLSTFSQRLERDLASGESRAH